MQEKDRGKMRAIADQLREEGALRGMEQIVVNMLESNVALDSISKVIKPSTAEIEKLKKRLH